MGRRCQIAAKGLLLAAAACVALSGAAFARGLSAEELVEFERLLAELNFDPGKIDGVVDARTRTAVGLYQEFAALPVDGVPSAMLLAELRQVVQAFADMKATQATAQAEAAPPAELETALAVAEPEPEVAEAPQPVEPEPEPAPEAAKTPPAKPEAAETPPPEPEVAEAPQPVEPEPEPEPEVAEAPPHEPEPEVAEAPQPTEPEPEAAETPTAKHEHEPTPESEAPAPSETQEAEAPAAEETKARFDLDNMIARLVQPGGGPVPRARTAPAQAPSAQVLLGGEATGGGTGERTARAPSALKFPAFNRPMADGYDAFTKGYAAVLAGDFDLAIEFYTRAIEGGDLALAHLADAFFNRANARSYKGALDFAIADYSSAIVNKPEFPGAYYNRGFALEAAGQHTRALANFMRARSLGLRRLGVRSPDVRPPKP